MNECRIDFRVFARASWGVFENALPDSTFR